MIDIHSHILSETDDGAVSLEDSLKIIQEAIEAGFTKIISTSHYYEGRFEKDEYFRKEKINNLRNMTGNFDLRIGSEIFATPDIIELLKEKKASSIDNTRYVLFEIPFGNNVSFFNKMIDDLKRNNYLPIMAHPERYEIVKNNPKLVEEWKHRGIYMQSNFESITGKYGKESEETVKLLLRHKLVDFLGSDVHRVGTYEKVSIAIDKIRKMVDERYFIELTQMNQEKLLRNEKIEVEDQDEIKKTIFGGYK